MTAKIRKRLMFAILHPAEGLANHKLVKINGSLLGLADQKSRSCRRVQEIAEGHLAEVRAKIAERVGEWKLRSQ